MPTADFPRTSPLAGGADPSGWSALCGDAALPIPAPEVLLAQWSGNTLGSNGVARCPNLAMRREPPPPPSAAPYPLNAVPRFSLSMRNWKDRTPMMDWVIDQLAPNETWSLVWRAAVLGSALYLIALGSVAIAAPVKAQRFLGGFAQTQSANLFEAVLRLIAGLAFMGASPNLRLPELAFWVGAFLSASAIVLVLLFPVHKKFASWAVPFSQRHLRLIALGALLLGGLVLWLVF